ncbi:KGG domain-containing protein [Herbaspirillum sp. NPDC087042]|uniref:KGG domain-containing protein n=1 Tax=Herbaspirillum sp. NPDC087042 TaxID=3364004 RepID=UPI0037FFA64D
MANAQNPGNSHRGFAAMDREKQRQIASMGGKAAHAKGAAHEFTSAEAREAGRKGGLNSHGRKSAANDAAMPQVVAPAGQPQMTQSTPQDQASQPSAPSLQPQSQQPQQSDEHSRQPV